MSERSRAVLRVLWTGVFALVFTGVISGVWAGLLLANLATTPAIPWAVAVMALVLWSAWSLMGGRWWGLEGSKAARRALLRAGSLPRPLLGWAVAAGVLWVIALAGFWIVLHQLVPTPGNPLPDFSKYPPTTTIAALAMAAVSGGVSEEAAFRGYFQGALERAGLGWAALVVVALVIAPVHALTQGFVWPNLLFYLLVDAMLGALAYVTGSIRPGVVVHAIGLFIFFAVIWPHDAARPHVGASGPDLWFWIHLGQTLVFAALSLAAFARLSALAKASGPD
jgi:membrane protease YdiL (CAAX protease family)